jgi:hypothetical protein
LVFASASAKTRRLSEELKMNAQDRGGETGGDEGARLAGEGVGRPMGRCRFSAQGTTMRFATPMIDGVITSTLMEPIVYPAIFFLWRSRRLSAKRKALGGFPPFPSWPE